MLRVDLVGKTRGSSAQGIVTLLLSNGQLLRVPWSVQYVSGARDLIYSAGLSHSSVAASDATAEVLSIGIGRVSGIFARRIEPAAKVEVGLWNEDGRYLGVLARIRDVLPGHYVFGLTGRSPAGSTLAPGKYRLLISAFPSGGGKTSFRTLHFRVKPAKTTTNAKTTATTRKGRPGNDGKANP